MTRFNLAIIALAVSSNVTEQLKALMPEVMQFLLSFQSNAVMRVSEWAARFRKTETLKLKPRTKARSDGRELEKGVLMTNAGVFRYCDTLRTIAKNLDDVEQVKAIEMGAFALVYADMHGLFDGLLEFAAGNNQP